MNRIATMSYNPHEELRKVTAIKAVRGMTSWGLKESKDFCDGLLGAPNSFPINEATPDESLQSWIHDINNSGYTISIVSRNNPVRRELNKQINSALAYASLAGQHDVVRALTKVLETHLSFDLTDEFANPET